MSGNESLPAALHCRELSRRVSDRFRVELIDWTIKAGAITVLLGPTGSGKSTALELLAGTLPIDSGELLEGSAAERRVETLERRRRRAWLPQRPRLIRGTVRDNVALPLRLRGDLSADSVARHLALWQLDELADRPVERLSGGERQLAALARVTIVPTELLLLDEPTVGLDPERVALVERRMRSAAERGTTIVWSTHHLHQARRVGDQVAFLFGGRLRETGPLAERFDAPSDVEFRRFLQGELPC